MVDKFDIYNILHYAWNKFQLIARSIMAAVVQALTLTFDYANLSKDQGEDILGRTFAIEDKIYSKTDFEPVSKD